MQKTTLLMTLELFSGKSGLKKQKDSKNEWILKICKYFHYTKAIAFAIRSVWLEN